MPKNQKQDRDGLYRRPNSPFWWASFTDPSGGRTRRSTRTRDRKEAEALLAKWRVEIHREQHWGQQPTRTFDELILRYLQETQDRKRSAVRDKAIAVHLYRYYTGREMDSLTAADVHGYITERRGKGITDSTIRRELSLLSAAINYAIKWWDWDIPNPVANRKPPQGEGRVRWLTQDEAAALIQAAASEPRAATHLVDFIRLALNTGMRRAEMLELDWQRVDLEAGLVYLEVQHTKTAKRRSVPLNQTALAVMRNRLRHRDQHYPGSPWVFTRNNGKRIKSVTKSFMTACRRADIKDFTIHDMRHCTAAWLVSAGVPLPEVRDLLGHSTIQVTERYAHLAPENVRAAVSVLDNLSSHSGHIVV